MFTYDHNRGLNNNNTSIPANEIWYTTNDGDIITPIQICGM